MSFARRQSNSQQQPGMSAAAAGRVRAHARVPPKLTDTGRRILLRTQRRPAYYPLAWLSDRTTFLQTPETRMVQQGIGLPIFNILPDMYRSVFGLQASPQAFLQSRAGLVFMTVSWLSYLSFLYDTTDSKSMLYPLLHSMDEVQEMSPPVYYATATALLLANSYVTAYAADFAGRFFGSFLTGLSERITGVRNSEWLKSRQVPLQESNAPKLRPDEPYAPFQKPLISSSMPLPGPTVDSLKPGRFLQTKVGLVFLTILWFVGLTHLYRTADTSKWYYSFLHSLDGLEELSPVLYYIAATALIVAHSYVTAYVADRLAFFFADTIDTAVQRVQNILDKLRAPTSAELKPSTPEADGYSAALIPKVFRSNYRSLVS